MTPSGMVVWTPAIELDVTADDWLYGLGCVVGFSLTVPSCRYDAFWCGYDGIRCVLRNADYVSMVDSCGARLFDWMFIDLYSNREQAI